MTTFSRRASYGSERSRLFEGLCVCEFPRRAVLLVRTNGERHLDRGERPAFLCSCTGPEQGVHVRRNVSMRALSLTQQRETRPTEPPHVYASKQMDTLGPQLCFYTIQADNQ